MNFSRTKLGALAALNAAITTVVAALLINAVAYDIGAFGIICGVVALVCSSAFTAAFFTALRLRNF